MAMQRATSGLAAKLNVRSREVFDKAKATAPVDQDFGDIPAGVDGVAKLAKCEFRQIESGKENAGEYTFQAMGVILEPDTFTDQSGNVCRVAGKQTRIYEPVFATPAKKRATQDDHVAWIVNQLKLLVGGTLEGFGPDQMEDICSILMSQDVYFRFSTSEGQRQPNQTKPMIFHNWHGRIMDYVAPDATEGSVVDDTPPATTAPQKATQAAKKPHVNGTTTTKQSPTNTAPTPPSQEFDEFGDIDSLAARADSAKGDTAAEEELRGIAIEAGVPEEDIDNADNWTEVVVLIKDQKSDGAAVNEDDEDTNGETDEDDETPGIPRVETCYKYKPDGKKKAVDVECVAVVMKKKMCRLKNLATNEVYDPVPFARVLQS